tara:strand:- start:157 stop:459 length:303 start_codon:yes stop_codon:yes gene_type:complete
MKITPKQRKEARNNEGLKYISLNIKGYDFKIGYGLDLKDANILVNNYSLTLNDELVIAWNTWSKLENKIDEIMNNNRKIITIDLCGIAERDALREARDNK